MVKKYTKTEKAVAPLHEIPSVKKHWIARAALISLLVVGVFSLGAGVFLFVAIYQYESTYAEKIYPGVRVDKINVGGQTFADVEHLLKQKSKQIQSIQFQFTYDQTIATISAKQIQAKYDESLGATQAYEIGRSGFFLADIYQQWKSATVGTRITSVLTMDIDQINAVLDTIAVSIDTPPQDALFSVIDGKVVAFKPSITGRHVDKDTIKQYIHDTIVHHASQDMIASDTITTPLPIVASEPTISTEKSNAFGILEQIGHGESTYFHSIPGRVHNVALAASRIHGHLVPPGEIFSFNNALGDVSAATGYQQAYVIKNGRTVLGDGGGVCQVSTTLFRAALNSGLPIEEQHAHSYRVGYYEQGSALGLDATVFAPSYDLKFKNDTGHYILIQAINNPDAYSLSFDLYGTKDGRVATVTTPVILSQTPAPADLYQDDPTLPIGVVKQVDWKATGAKVKYQYSVQKDGKQLIDQTFFITYQPWQSVFLRGTKSG